MPELYEAIEVIRGRERTSGLEVQKHLGNNLGPLCGHGYNRWTSARHSRQLRPARRSWFRLDRPPWDAFSMFWVSQWMKKAMLRLQRIIRFTAAPTFEEQSTRVEVFETGIKVVDLIAPFTKGGKTGIFGGAGVGKTVIIMELHPLDRDGTQR